MHERSLLLACLLVSTSLFADETTLSLHSSALPSLPAPVANNAATAASVGDLAYVFGGSENPYNYNGLGYDGNPSAPARHGLLFDLETFSWQVIIQDNAASMDHRGLVPFGDGWVVVGGMLAKQTTTNAVTRYLLR